jgi:hypothetical protein
MAAQVDYLPAPEGRRPRRPGPASVSRTVSKGAPCSRLMVVDMGAMPSNGRGS